MKTIKEYFKLYSSLYQFEEGDSERLIDEEDFKIAMKEYALEAIKEDRKNVAIHAKTEEDLFIGGIFVDEYSIINAPLPDLK